MSLVRGDWGGANQDVDLHLEEHTGLVDQAFEVSSQLAQLMNLRSLRGTNTLRVDRLGSVTVQGRRAGEDLNDSAVKQDKLNLVVDTVCYLRHRFDKFDDWTSSIDTRRELSKADGTAMAKHFDQACLIQAMKCADFKAPDHLRDAFNDGVEVPVAVSGAAADASASANALVIAHRKSLEALILRDLGDDVLREGLTIVDPGIFSLLLQHDKLMNVQFGAQAGNNFVGGRIAELNGVRLMESARMPTAAITSNPLGSQFLLSAAQAKRRMVTMVPSMALIGAEVSPLSADYWEWKEKFCWVLDTTRAFTVGQRRPDAVAAVAVTIS